MKRADLDSVSLEYEEVGDGEPIVAIHGALIADSFRPLVTESTLTDRYRLITYRRRGYESGIPADAGVSIGQQAADCRDLMDHLGIERAHIVAHSLGGVIALQLALDAPESISSLALLEAALMVGGSRHEYRESLEQDQARYRESDVELVVENFLRVRFGDDPRAVLESFLPEGFEQGVSNASTFFEFEIPALMQWGFSEEQAGRIHQPVLVALGSDSVGLSPRFQETYDGLLDWLPNAEGFILPGATHAMQMQNPHTMGEALVAFFDRNPIPSKDAER